MMRTMRTMLRTGSVVVALVAAAGAVAAVDVDNQAKLLADTAAGAASGMTTSSTFTGMNGQAYFRASNGTKYQLWRSSGRARGTFVIPGSEGISSDPVAMNGASSVMFFTGAGTLKPLKAYDTVNKQVVTISPLAMAPLPAVGGLDSPTLLIAAHPGGFPMAGTRALFIAPVGTINTLWATDGTASGTGPVADPTVGTVGNITPAGQYVYYTTRSTTNVYTLWRTDGTPMNPMRIANLRSAPTWSVESSGMRAIGERVLFSQTVSGNSALTEVWVSDGSSEGTHAVAQTPVQTSVLPFAFDGNGLFSTRMTATAMEMWRMSSNPAECVNLMNFARATRFMSFGSYGNISLFGDAGGSQYNTNTNNAVTIWVTDGTGQNTLGIPNFPGAPANSSVFGTQSGTPANVMAGDTLYVDSAVGSGGHEPWRVNLTTGAIGVLRDIQPGGASSNPTKFFALDHNRGAAFFAYDTPNHYALYASNGTPEGTRLVSRLAGVPNQYSPKSIGSRVFMVGGVTTNGYEPYAVDLCPADYDNSGVVNVDDLFVYLTDWFAGAPDADVQGAVGLPDVADLMAFINIWLTPCEQ